MRDFRFVSSGLALALLTVGLGCRSTAVMFAPRKSAELASSELAERAKSSFRKTLLEGDYAGLPGVTETLTAAYLAAPRDPELALYVAHAHLWRVAERVREAAPRATITDHMTIAETYFYQALALRPDDHRILGWLGGVQMALGKIHADEQKGRQGYFVMEDGVARFPEFNHFSKSYALSSLPPGHARFPEAVEAMWRSIEVCATGSFDRRHPNYGPVFRPTATADSRRPHARLLQPAKCAPQLRRLLPP